PADDFRRNHPRFQGANFQKNLDLVSRVEEIAREKGCTPTQLVLAWLLGQGQDIVPIPGTKHRRFLEENVRAPEFVLTPAEMERIAEVAPKGVTAGDRYPQAGGLTHLLLPSSPVRQAFRRAECARGRARGADPGVGRSEPRHGARHRRDDLDSTSAEGP